MLDQSDCIKKKMLYKQVPVGTRLATMRDNYFIFNKCIHAKKREWK